MRIHGCRKDIEGYGTMRCKWKNPEGDACQRTTIESDFCSGHRRALNVAAIHPQELSQTSELAFIAVLLYFAYCVFQWSQIAITYFLVFQAGIATDTNVAENPIHSVFALGVGLCLLGKMLSLCRDIHLPPGFYSKAMLLGLLSFGFGILLSDDKSHIFLLGTMVLVALFLFQLERRSGIASFWTLATGLSCLVLGGLFVPLMELTFQLGGTDYLSSLYPTQYSSRTQAAVLHVAGALICVVVSTHALVDISVADTRLPRRHSSSCLAYLFWISIGYWLLTTVTGLPALPYDMMVPLIVLIASCIRDRGREQWRSEVSTETTFAQLMREIEEAERQAAPPNRRRP